MPRLLGALCATALFFISVLPTHAAEWDYQISAGGYFYGLDVYLQKVMAVGGSGSVRVSEDGGHTWRSSSAGTDRSLLDVQIVDATTAYAVGSFGTVVKTTNLGSTWTSIHPATGSAYNAVFFITPTIGYIAGSTSVRKTTNGGTDWVARSPASSLYINDLWFVSEMTGWVVGDMGRIRKTVDGGENWTSQTSNTTKNLRGVQFYNSSLGYAVGDDATVIKTTDGGTTWTSVSISGVPATTDLYAVRKYGVQVVIVGEGGVIARTTNDGATWTVDDTSFSTMRAVDIASTGVPYAADTSGRVIVYDAGAPTIPTALSKTPTGSPINNPIPGLQWSTSTDALTSVSGYEVKFDSGSYLFIGNTTGHTPALPLSDGTHTFYVRAKDRAVNYGSAASLSFTVDTTPPSVGPISPLTATVGAPVAFSAPFTDTNLVSSCNIYIDNVEVGVMTRVAGTASQSRTFGESGAFAIQAHCRDEAGNTGRGATTTVTVAASGSAPAPGPAADTTAPSAPDEPPPPPASLLQPPTSPTPVSPTPVSRSGRLVKLTCPSGADVNHPCKAVYYVSALGRRHAFPNERIFFSWYVDFSTVQAVSQDELTLYPLARNAPYRPGLRMVKFPSVNTVYVVARGGLLRPVASEDVARTLYGANWNQRVDDLSEAFFTNYTFGAPVAAAPDFTPAAETAAVTTLDVGLE